MKKINYKSDFDFILRLLTATGEDVGWPPYDWQAVFRTSSRDKVFRAGCTAGVPFNCYNDNGRIHIVADNHGLPPGKLFYELSENIPEDIFPDGARLTVTPAPLDITLTVHPSDLPTSAEVEAQLPYIKGEPFRYEDFTPAQIAEFQRPARDAAVIAAQAAASADLSTAKALSAAERAEAAVSSASTTEALIEKAEGGRVVAETERDVAEADRNAAEVIRRDGYEQMQDILSGKADRAELPQTSRQSFDDMWLTAVGSYGCIDHDNSPDAPYICNDIQMAYEEAKKVMMASAMTTSLYSFKFATKRNAGLRTLLPLHVATSSNTQPSQAPNGLFRELENLEIVQFVGDFVSYNANSIFADCVALREIRGRVRLQNPTGIPRHFLNCRSLEEIRLFSLYSDPDLSACRNLSRESLLYMIEHALRTGYAITVHPDVFAKLTDETNAEWSAVLAKAAEKNITFATL